jgi:hypothetical protein
MARAVKFLSITPLGPANPTALAPAPNVTDWEEIKAGLEGAPVIIHVDALLEGTHDIRGTYRGWNIYLYPNVHFYRDAPQTRGGHGMAGWPEIGMKEQVTVYMDDQKYAAQVEFV